MEETATGSENEQIPEEGGEEETGVILPGEPTADPAPEAPAEEPAPEAPAEEPALETPAEEEAGTPTEEAPAEEVPVVDEEPTEETPIEEDAEINADPEPVKRTVTITGWKDSGTTEAPVAGLNQKVTVTASASEGDATFDTTEGTIEIQDGKTLTLNVAAKAGYKLDSVAIGAGETIQNGSNYSAVISANANVTITVSEPTYSLKFTTAEAGVKIKLDDAVKADSDKAELATTETANIKRGAEPKDLAFTITGLGDSGVAAGKKLHVSVKADGSAVADEITVTETKSTDNKVTYSCKIDKADIAALRTGLEVIVEVEAGASVKVADADATNNNDKVEVKFWAKKATSEFSATEGWLAPDATAAGLTVVKEALAGETFRFQVKMKTDEAATYTIAKVEAKYTDTADAAQTVTATAKGSDDEYNFVMPAGVNASGVSIVVTTKVDDTKTRALTFAITGGDDTATATITEIVTEVPAVTGANATPVVTKTYTEGDEEAASTGDLADFPGLTESREISVKDGLKLPKAIGKAVVKSIKVQVAAEADYDLTKVNSTAITAENLAAASLLTYADTTLTDTIAITAETDVKKAASTTTFGVKTANADAGFPENASITVGGDAQVKTAATADDPAVYELKENAKVVTLTVKTKEDYEILKTGVTGVTGGVKSVASKAPANNEVEWTIELLAAKMTSLNGGDITIATAAKTVKVQLAPIEGGNEPADPEGYDVSGRQYTPMGAAEGTTPTTVTNGNTAIPYGAKYEMTITPASGVNLSKVSYKMGEAGTETPVDLEPYMEGGVDKGRDMAKLVIAKVTDDVVITVETTDKAYELTPLAVVADPETPVVGIEVDTDVYNIYQVSPSGAYAVGLTEAGDAVNLVENKVTAVVKNASGTAVTMPKVVFGSDNEYLLINLAGKNLGGQEITIDMMKDGASVGTYRLQVAKEATYVRLKEGNKIRQNVDSVKTYTVETDGELSDIDVTAVSAGTGSFDGDVTVEYDNNGNVEITLAPMASTDVVTVTPGAEGAEATKTYRNVTFTLTAAGTSNVHQIITLEAEPVFDPTKKPNVTAVMSGASDTSFYVDVEMESTATKTGKLYYEVTATAKAKDGDGADAKTFAAVAGSKLESSVALPLNDATLSNGGKRRIKIDVAKDGVDLGNGVAWSYDVTAKLVYKNGATVVESSADSDAAAAGTVDTYFASALKLVKNGKKKPASTLYTGQHFDTPQYLATPTFTDKKVNYKITDKILVDGAPVNPSKMNVFIDDNGDLVVDSVGEGWSNVGKHTITVTATADMTGKDNLDMSGEKHTMYASRATINVTVARGIESIAFTGLGTKLYKAPGKAATLNIASKNIYFNGDTTNKDKYDQPKSKKVTYQVVGAGSTLSNLKPAPAGITMKGTKVTVDKNFAIDPVKTHNNKFMILVKAADYKENTTAQLSGEFTVTGEAISLDNLVLAKAQREGGYKVLAVQADKTTRTPVSAAEAYGAQIFVLGKPATVGKTYSPAQWARLAAESPTNFTYKGSKKNVWEVYGLGYFYAYAGGVKADITVTANDGKKASKKLLLDLGWTETDGKDLALKIWTTNEPGYVSSYYYDETVYTPNKVQPDKDIESKATGTPRYYVQVMQGAKNDGTSTSFPNEASYVNCDLKVKGGKIVSKGNNAAYITATSEKTVITLTDKNVAKGQKAKVYNYTILNKGFSKSLNKMSVKVTSKPNNLWNRAKTSEQKLDLALMNGKDPVAKGKIAKIEVDWSARTDKNSYMYADFNSMIDSGAGAGKEAFFTIGEDGKTTLSFRADGYDYVNDVDCTNLYVGSYKLKVTVGTGTGTSFKPESQAANLTVKVTSNKKFTFKPTTSYTFNPVDGAIALTGKASVGKGELVGVNFSNLQNANVNGKSNKFTRLFYIDTDAKTGMQYLKLNTNSVEVLKLMYDVKEASKDKADAELTAADFDMSKAARVPDLTKINKNDLNGYITYYAEADKGWYNTYASGTVKITVKIAKLPVAGKAAKASQKYTPAETQIKSGKANETTPVNVYINGVYVTVGLAMVDPGKKDEGNLIVEGDGVNDNGQILVKAKTALENGKKYSANLLVVPKNSIYYATVKAAAAAAAAKTNAEGEASTTPTTPAATRADLMKLYGIPVKVTVVGAEKPVYAEAPSYNPGGEGGDNSESTVIEAKSAINSITNWTTTVTKKADDSGIEDTAKNTAKTALETEIREKMGDNYSVITFTVTDIVLKAGDNTKAEATVTIAKTGETTETVVITIGAVAAEAEKTAADAKTAIQTMDADTTNCPWNAVAASKITIQYDPANSNAAVDGDTKAAEVATKVETWLKTQTGYATGFTVTAKSPTSITFDTTAGTATVGLQVSKTGDATPTDVNVTVLAAAKSD